MESFVGSTQVADMHTLALAGGSALAFWGPGEADVLAVVLGDFNLVALHHVGDVVEGASFETLHEAPVGVRIDRGCQACLFTSTVIARAAQGHALESGDNSMPRVWHAAEVVGSSGDTGLTDFHEVWNWHRCGRGCLLVEPMEVVLLEVAQDTSDDLHTGSFVVTELFD